MNKRTLLAPRAAIAACWMLSLAASLPAQAITEESGTKAQEISATMLQTKLEDAFEHANDVVLYSISSDAAGPSDHNFHEYPVLGKAALHAAEARAVFAEIQRSLPIWNLGGGFCFHPHHGLSWRSGTHRYELVICYLCGVVVIYEDSIPIGALNSLRGTPTVLRAVSNSHGLPVSRVLSDAERQETQSRNEQAHWLQVMPASIRPAWKDFMESSGRTGLKPMQAALAQAVPDKKQRILILFAWYASGAGPWSGAPGYEQIVADLLRAYPFSDLAEAAQSKSLSDRELAGAARFFEGSNQTDDRRILTQDLDLYFHTVEAWGERIPHSIKPLWSDETWFSSRVDQIVVRQMVDALAIEYPDKNQRQLVLLAWYGSGADRSRSWRYGYENVVAQLLFEFSSLELVEALQSTSLSERQMDGAARLLADWYFQRERRGDIQSFPPPLKAALLAHIRQRGVPEWEKYSAAFK